MNKVVAVVFGGRSCEHEVSILTAHEAMAVLKAMSGYDVLPIYITKQGRWLTGDVLADLDKFADAAQLESQCKPLMLRPTETDVFAIEGSGWTGKPKPLHVDVVLPVIHGPNGEDGTLQGALEMLRLPYAGSGVLASALCMDKLAMKRLFDSFGLPQVPYLAVHGRDWRHDRAGQLAKADALTAGPLFVKPARGGSSIGITFVDNHAALAEAIDMALRFDDEVVIEKAVTDPVEVNCSVLRGIDGLQTSVLEAIHPENNFLTYDQKYLQWSKGGAVKGAQGGGAESQDSAGAKGGAKGAASGGLSGHTIPADIPAEVAQKIDLLARGAFDAAGCDGVARIDFLLDGDEVYVNEVNTLPGSLAFYLWEATGVSFDKLLETMLKAAEKRAQAKDSLTFSLDRNLLADIEARKGAKRPQ